MKIKELTIYGIVLVVINTCVACGIFVTFPQMTAYAAPKEDITNIHIQLNRIEQKIDKLIMGY